MELLTEKIKESTNFQALAKVLIYHYQNQAKRKTIISYNEFKELLTNFIEEIMTNKKIIRPAYKSAVKRLGYTPIDEREKIEL